MSDPSTAPGTHRLPKPAWLTIDRRVGAEFAEVRRLMRDGNLHTVCEEARCPNRHECWGRQRTATFLILGGVCTRGCAFCSVRAGTPAPPDPDEPARVAEAVRRLSLRHAVVTMVTRDDLVDGGAAQVAATVRAVRAAAPDCSIEVLVSDFGGDEESVAVVLAAAPDVFGHNLETVRRVSGTARRGADYDRSLGVLAAARRLSPSVVVKSALLLGLGETREEILGAIDDLAAVGVRALALGQYLQPAREKLPVARYWTPEEFAALKAEALARGFASCEAGPLVRSSYHAAEQYAALI